MLIMQLKSCFGTKCETGSRRMTHPLIPRSYNQAHIDIYLTPLGFCFIKSVSIGKQRLLK